MNDTMPSPDTGKAFDEEERSIFAEFEDRVKLKGGDWGNDWQGVPTEDIDTLLRITNDLKVRLEAAYGGVADPSALEKKQLSPLLRAYYNKALEIFWKRTLKEK